MFLSFIIVRTLFSRFHDMYSAINLDYERSYLHQMPQPTTDILLADYNDSIVSLSRSGSLLSTSRSRWPTRLFVTITVSNNIYRVSFMHSGSANLQETQLPMLPSSVVDHSVV